MAQKIPQGLYGPHTDGFGDPRRMTPAQRARMSEARHVEEVERRDSKSHVVRHLQRATDATFGGAR